MADYFTRLDDAVNAPHFHTRDLLVVFAAFAPLTAMEANQAISPEEVEGLMATIGNPDLWKIHQRFESVTFMFYTDEQTRQSEQHGLLDECGDLWFDLMIQHDELGYLSRSELLALADSKENLDKNYKSSFFLFDR